MRDNVASWRRLAIRPRMLVGVGRARPIGHGARQAPPASADRRADGIQRLAQPRRRARDRARRGEAADGGHLPVDARHHERAALAEDAPECGRWFQLYVFADRGVTRELMAQAAEHGYEALVVTVDLPVLGVRERELRTGVHAATADAVASAIAAGAKGAMTTGGLRRR